MVIMAKDLAALAWDIWYMANKSYVAKELCVNKAKPKMHCNGKCHLAKQLQKLEESESGKNTPAKQKSTIPKNAKGKELSWISAEDVFHIETEPAFSEVTTNGWLEPSNVPRACSSRIFHPPTV
jgi:hypothetical protein